MNLDPTNIDELVSNASVYELFCLTRKISHILETSEQIEQIRNTLQIGQAIEYFNSKFNKLLSAVIVEKQAQKILVKHIQDDSTWWTRYYTINLNRIELTPVASLSTKTLSRRSLSIGDTVGFEHNGNKIIGEVLKLNPKTAKLLTKNRGIWTVYYEHLFQVIDSSTVIDVNFLAYNEDIAK